MTLVEQRWWLCLIKWTWGYGNLCMAVLFTYNNCGLKSAFMFAYPFRMKGRKSVLILRFSLMSLFSLSLPPLSLPFLLYSSSLFFPLSICFMFLLTLLISFSSPSPYFHSHLPHLSCTHFFSSFSLHLPLYIAFSCATHPHPPTPGSFLFIPWWMLLSCPPLIFFPVFLSHFLFFSPFSKQ